MSLITIYPEVECSATASTLHDTEVVGVADVTGNHQFLRVGRGFLTREAGRTFLPVLVIEVDQPRHRALVQLPYEADSGASRVWVPIAAFRREGSQPRPAEGAA